MMTLHPGNDFSETVIGNTSEGGPSGWLTEGSNAVQHLKTQLLSAATQLLSLQDVIESARWEAFVLGEWPYKEYKVMLEVEQDMVAVLALVSCYMLSYFRRELN